MLVVSDTSAIVALECVQLMPALAQLYGDVLIPPAVHDELCRGGRSWAPVNVAKYSFMQVRAPSDAARVEELRERIDAGEAEAIALAIEIHADLLLIDEWRGRRAAARYGLAVTGTLGVFLRAKDAGLVCAVLPLIQKLEREICFFLSPALRAQALKLAGEIDSRDEETA